MLFEFILDASNTENVTNIPSTEGIFNSSESGEEIIQKSAEDQCKSMEMAYFIMTQRF